MKFKKGDWVRPSKNQWDNPGVVVDTRRDTKTVKVREGEYASWWNEESLVLIKSQSTDKGEFYGN